MYLDYIIFQIHQLFNKLKKAKVTYKCDPLMCVKYKVGKKKKTKSCYFNNFMICELILPTLADPNTIKFTTYF